MNPVIYKITSPTNRIYIGQTTDFVARVKNYLSLRCKTQVKLYRSFLKYGTENHKIEIIEECDFSVLNERERFYQEEYNAASEDNLNCLLTKTNTKKRQTSEKTRLNYSIAQLNSPNSRKGKKHSEESRLKIKAKRALQVITEDHKMKISLNSGSARLVFCQKTGIFYDRIKDAAFANNIKPNYLICSLIGRNKNNKHLIYA